MRGAIIKTKSIEIYEEGIEKGRIKGENDKAKAIAIQLKKRGITNEDIADIVDAPSDEVQKWLNESN